jgi:hypothetical protein
MAALAVLSIVGGIVVPKTTSLRDRILVERHARAVVRRISGPAGVAAGLVAYRALHQRSALEVWVLKGADSSLVWRAPVPRKTASHSPGPRARRSRPRASPWDWQTADLFSSGEESVGRWWRRAWGGSG